MTTDQQIAANRQAAILRSVRNLIAMTTEELRRIDCGGWTMKTREHVNAELRVHYEWLAQLA